MARPLRILFPDAYDHVTCCGNERKAIFRDDNDRAVFIEKLKASRDIYDVEIHAYVLMPNHFHFIVKTPKGNLEKMVNGLYEIEPAIANRVKQLLESK